MKNQSLPKRLFEKNLPLNRPIFNLKRGRRGQSKISAILAIAALILATTLTVLLMKNTVS
jgi:hypothetical protein